MSYTLTPEEKISMLITNVCCNLEHKDIETALAFLDALKSDWEKFQRGELEPMTIHTGSNV